VTRDTPGFSVREYGDAAVLVDIGPGSRTERWALAHALARDIRERRPPGVIEAMAAFDTVYVAYDPVATDAEQVEGALAGLPRGGGTKAEGRRFTIPVVYGGEFGPDLTSVASELGLTDEALVALHTDGDWTVRFLGAPVGAPMLEGPPLPGRVARCRQPRTRIPAGSVAVSGEQCVIYPTVCPGGWRLIGRTPVRLCDNGRGPAGWYQPGDSFRFRAVPAEQWDALPDEAAAEPVR